MHMHTCTCMACRLQPLRYASMRRHSLAPMATGRMTPQRSPSFRPSTPIRRPTSPKGSPVMRPTIPRSGLSSSTGALPRLSRATSLGPGAHMHMHMCMHMHMHMHMCMHMHMHMCTPHPPAHLCTPLHTPTLQHPSTHPPLHRTLPSPHLTEGILTRAATAAAEARRSATVALGVPPPTSSHSSRGRSPQGRSPLMRSATLGSPVRARPALRRISSRSPPISSGQISPRSSPSLSGTSSPGIFSGILPPMVLGGLSVAGGRGRVDGAPAAPLATAPPNDGSLGQSALPSDTPPTLPPSPPSEQISRLLDEPTPLLFTPMSTPPAAGGPPPSTPSVVYEDTPQPVRDSMARPLTPGSKMKTSMSFHSAEQARSVVVVVVVVV